MLEHDNAQLYVAHNAIQWQVLKLSSYSPNILLYDVNISDC
jgi:hypothetical protein